MKKSTKLSSLLLLLSTIAIGATGMNVPVNSHPEIERAKNSHHPIPARVQRVMAMNESDHGDYHANPDARDSEGARLLPFSCTFPSAEEMDQEWNVINANEDGNLRKWRWRSESEEDPGPLGETDGGFARVLMNSSQAADDWLVTKYPVSLPQGLCHITFYVKGIKGRSERLKVFYGTSDDVNSMTELLYLKDYETSEWEFKKQEFTVPAAGDYYFAFYACSEENKNYVAIDNIFIDKGRFIGNADIDVEYLDVPYSSCGLGAAERIGVTFKNKGTDRLTKFAFTYTVNNSVPVTQIFTQNVEVGEEKTVYFDRPVDMSVEGETYSINVKGEVIPQNDEKEEFSIDNNDCSALVTHYTPAELPVRYDFTDSADRSQWGSTRFGWEFDEYTQAMNPKVDDPLISRCVYFDKDNEYRISSLIKAGYYLAMMGITFTDNWNIAVGKVGTPLNTWQTVSSRRDIYTDDAYITDECVFHCEESGIYNIAFIPVGDADFICLRGMDIARIADHDLRVESVRSSLGRLTPAALATDPDFSVEVANRGLKDAKGAYVSLLADNELLAESPAQTIGTNKAGVFEVSGRTSLPVVGTVNTFTLTATAEVEDENISDNSYDFSFTATDSEYAFDNIEGTPLTGIGASTLKMGNIFKLPVAATLGSIVVGWMDYTGIIEEDLNATIYVYPLDKSGKVDSPVITLPVKRPIEGGFVTYSVDSEKLDAGEWLICLAQEGAQNFGLGNDDDKYGFVSVLRDNQLGTISGYGYVAVRANFVVDRVGMDEMSVNNCITTEIIGRTLNVSGEDLREIRILDMAGIARRHAKVAGNSIEVDLSGIEKGCYLLIMTTNEESIVRKISL